MIEFLFIDLDDTILDFHKAERVALEKTLRSLGLEPTDTVMSRYSQINKEHWERLERKEITREFLLVSRFAQLMEEFGIEVPAELCARTYENNLSIGHYFMPGAREAVEALSKKYKLYITSNGTSKIFSSPRTLASTSRIRAILIGALPGSPVLIPQRL